MCPVLQALEVNSKLNCATALLTESLKQLEDIETHKDGLLYGIPISIKENFDYEVLEVFVCVCILAITEAEDILLDLKKEGYTFFFYTFKEKKAFEIVILNIFGLFV